MECAPRPRGGASALWEDVQALAALLSSCGSHFPEPAPLVPCRSTGGVLRRASRN